ncbi:MAG TPA: glycosyl hydrolase family 8 [Tabrizicola sp.]|nr:glycosyl hydrolase family 8 [Tabrizicola sp.]
MRLSVLFFLGFASLARADGYREGLIYPSDPDRHDQVLAFYNAWKADFLVEGCGDGRAYVRFVTKADKDSGKDTSGTLTVSEAHGYGMLILVLMAEHDPEAQRLFDAMLAYRDDHPAASDPGLMAWRQVEGCDNAPDGGDNTATDGDLDIAYALVLADRQWGGYRDRALQVMQATLDRVKSREGDFLTIGDWANDSEAHRGGTRSSDFMPTHFCTFAKASKDETWMAILDATYAIIDAAAPEPTGLTPDFITGLPDAPRPALPEFLEGKDDGAHSWNAVRTPWRLALDDILTGESRARRRLLLLNAFVRQATGGDPLRIADGYALDGMALNPDWDGGMVFTSMFAVSAMVDPSAPDWLDALWARMVETPVTDEGYYGNTLKMLAMITLDGGWK